MKLKNSKEMSGMMKRIMDTIFGIRKNELSLGTENINERVRNNVENTCVILFVEH